MACCGKGGSGVRVPAKDPIELPEAKNGRVVLFSISTTPAQDLATVPTGARYRLRNNMSVFYAEDAAHLTAIRDDNGTQTWLDAAAYLEYKNPTVSTEPETPPILATASAIKLADDNGIDLTLIVGSGKGGKVTKADVQNVIEG